MALRVGIAISLALLGLSACSGGAAGGGNGPGARSVRVASPASSTSSSSSSTTSTTPVVPPSTQRPAPTTTRSRPPAAVVPSAAGDVGGHRSLGTFTATCYGAFEGYGGKTASGHQAGPGSIATDPRVIPTGTRLVVAGYGPGVANDVGGAIKGHRIDIWFRTAAECRTWGSRSVEVWAA